MRRYTGRAAANTCLAAGVTCLCLACAADPGDPLKSSSAVSSSGSSSSSGAGNSASSSGVSSSGSSGASSSGMSSSSGSSSGTSSSGSGGGASSSGSSGASSSGSSGVSSSGAVSEAGPDEVGPPEAGPIIPEGGASCVTAGCPLKVQYKSSTTAASTTTIGPDLNIVNEGAAGDLANIKIHYYFTAEGDTSLEFDSDYAGYFNSGMTGFGATDVTGAFVAMGANATPYADTYLEISFASASLPANATVSVNFRVHDRAFATTYSQTNDWSFFSNTNSASYVDAPYITAYVNGALAWGIEPGPIAPDAGDASTADTGAGSDGAGQDASISDARPSADAGDGG
jgi:hypothetical protein